MSRSPCFFSKPNPVPAGEEDAETVSTVHRRKNVKSSTKTWFSFRQLWRHLTQRNKHSADFLEEVDKSRSSTESSTKAWFSISSWWKCLTQRNKVHPAKMLKEVEKPRSIIESPTESLSSIESWDSFAGDHEENIAAGAEHLIDSPGEVTGRLSVIYEVDEDSLLEETQTPTLIYCKDRGMLLNKGLMNFGNSCYINASLQCLFSAESFCRQLVETDWGDDPSATISRLFVELWSLRNSSRKVLTSSVLLDLIGEVTSTNQDFTIDEQNDAHKFLLHLLSQMHLRKVATGDMNPNCCPVKSHFAFFLTCTIRCEGCGATKSSNVEFYYLSLGLVPDTSVQDCLNLYLSKEEPLDCQCQVCGGNSSSGRWEFYTLPRILILQLKRFQISANGSIIKCQSQVPISPELHLNLPKNRPLDCGDPSEATEKTENRTNAPGVRGHVNCSLISVLNHIGTSLQSGHYMSDCFDQKTSYWLSFDDRDVSWTTQENMLQERQDSAYILFYQHH